MFGTGGMIYLEDRDCGTINVTHNDGGAERISYRPQRGFYNELLNFHNAAVGLEPISVTPEMEFGDAMTVFAILDSIRQGSIIKVDRDTEYSPDYGAFREQPPVENRPWLQ